MSTLQRKRWLRFEIQHIFVSELGKGDFSKPARDLLAEVGFNLESRGNKMALLSSPESRDAIRNAPQNVQQ